MSSRNTNIYRKYYNDFQNKLKEKYIITYKLKIKEKNDKI